MLTRLTLALLAFALGSAAGPAGAVVNVFACEPEWGALATEIGANRVSVFNATTARQDVHKVQARPSLIARARSADLLVCSGADLELGWLPMVLNQAGNGKILPGKPGYLEAANYVQLIDVPVIVDRSLGDVHPRGNPHIQWNPRNILQVAAELRARLVRIDPGGAGDYQKAYDSFAQRWTDAMRRWEQAGATLRGVGVIEHHRALTYLFGWLGMPVLGSLEPKPGVEPTSAHLSELVETQKATPARLIVRSTVNSAEASNWLAKQTGLPAVELPYTVGGAPGADDLFGLYDQALRLLLEAARA
jgi:zinc/manganese transport system substrate-binding protein